MVDLTEDEQRRRVSEKITARILGVVLTFGEDYARTICSNPDYCGVARDRTSLGAGRLLGSTGSAAGDRSGHRFAGAA
jgi:hypothetical protein